MDAKYIVENLEALLSSDNPDNSNLLSNDIGVVKDSVKEIKSLRKKIKAEQSQKKECASQFKFVRDSEEKLADLKLQMQKISGSLKDSEEKKKTLEKKLEGFFSAPKKNEHCEPILPCQFSPLPGAGKKRGDLRIIVAENSFQKHWDEYVSGQSRSSVYHLFGWKRLIERSFSHRCFYLLAFNSENSVVGVFPIVWIKSTVFGSYGVSVPFFNYGGPLADSLGVATELIGKAIELAKEYGWEHLELRTTDRSLQLPSVTRKVSMIRKLPETFKEFQAQVGTKVRAQAKLADKVEPHIKFGGKELLKSYYQVFAVNMRDLGTPVYSKKFFENILDDFPEKTTVVVVSVKGKPAAAAFLIGYNQMLEIPWASTLGKYNGLSLNMWMYYKILEFAIVKKYKFFDFGRSTVDSGTYRFKKQWGAEAVQHHWYYWLPENGALPALNPDNPKFLLAIRIWKKLPLFLTKILGPFIVKNLP